MIAKNLLKLIHKLFKTYPHMERELPSWLQPPKAEKPELAQDATRREFLRVQFEKAFSTSGDQAPRIAQEAMKLVSQDGVDLTGRSKDDLRKIADTYAMKLYKMSQKPAEREAMVTPSTEALAEAQRMQQAREASEKPPEENPISYDPTLSRETLGRADEMRKEREAKEQSVETPEQRADRARDAFVEAMTRITNDVSEARGIYRKYVPERDRNLLADMSAEKVASLAERYAERVPIALGEALESMLQEEIPELPDENIEPLDQPQSEAEKAA